MQLADSGIFTCVAASPAGVADRNFTLQVHGKEPGGVWKKPVLRPRGVRIKALWVYTATPSDLFSCLFVHLTRSGWNLVCQGLARHWDRSVSRDGPCH